MFVCVFIRVYIFTGVDIYMDTCMWREEVNLEVIPWVTPYFASETRSVADLECDDSAKPVDGEPQESVHLPLPGTGVISTAISPGFFIWVLGCSCLHKHFTN